MTLLIIFAITWVAALILPFTTYFGRGVATLKPHLYCFASMASSFILAGRLVDEFRPDDLPLPEYIDWYQFVLVYLPILLTAGVLYYFYWWYDRKTVQATKTRSISPSQIDITLRSWLESKTVLFALGIILSLIVLPGILTPIGTRILIGVFASIIIINRIAG